MVVERREASPSRSGALAVAVLTAILFACDADDEVAPLTTPADYAVPLRSDAELRDLLAAACRRARAGGNPRVLVEFSAAWCSDCRRLHEMKRAPVLASELEAWPRVTVNVGRFDRHRDLLDALDVTRIAHWSIFEPSDCTAPLPTWSRRVARTLEVSSGEARDLTPQDLARWLAGLRAG